MTLVKGIVAEGGFATAVLGDGNKISATVAYAESYRNNFRCIIVLKKTAFPIFRRAVFFVQVKEPLKAVINHI